MITGTIVITLVIDNVAADRKALGGLYALPDGVRVIVEVGSRKFVSNIAVDWLQAHADRVHLDVHGEVEAVDAWVRALRGNASPMAGWSA